MNSTGPEQVGVAGSSKTPKFNPVFHVDIEEDYGSSDLGGGDFKKREAQRYKAELATIDKVLKMSDADLAKFARAQLTAQRDVCEARMKLQATESLKISDVFSDMKDSDNEEGEAVKPETKEKEAAEGEAE